MAIRSPERRDGPDRRHAVSGDDLHQRIDDKRKQLDRRQVFRRESDRRQRPDLAAEQARAAVGRSADQITVHLLNIGEQIEGLLRSVRELQEHVLHVRRALPEAMHLQPAKAVQDRLIQMLAECNTLRDSVQAAASTAKNLNEGDLERAP